MVAKFFLDFAVTRRAGPVRVPRCRGPEADLGTLSSFKANSKPRVRLGGRSGSTAPKVTKTRFSHRGSGAARGLIALSSNSGHASYTTRASKKKQKEESTLGCSATELRRNVGKTFKRRYRHAHVSIKRTLVRIELTK